MNQMMGHAATAMSEMFQEKMDMTPPNVKFVTLKRRNGVFGRVNGSGRTRSNYVQS